MDTRWRGRSGLRGGTRSRILRTWATSRHDRRAYTRRGAPPAARRRGNHRRRAVVSPWPGLLTLWTSWPSSREAGSFDKRPGRERPAGWLAFFPKPEVHLRGDVLVPTSRDGAASACPRCRRSSAWSSLPTGSARCCPLPPSALDRTRKMAVYAREGVKHLWFVDPRPQTLEVYRLEGGTGVLLGTHTGDDPGPRRALRGHLHEAGRALGALTHTTPGCRKPCIAAPPRTPRRRSTPPA